MQALIVEADGALRSAIASALAKAGFDVACMADVAAAKAFARTGPVDLLLAAEAVGGRLAHDLALLAEWRNPLVASILLADREGSDLDELFALLPSLHAIVGRGTPPKTLARIAVEAARAVGGETGAHRLARRWAEAGGDADDRHGDAEGAEASAPPAAPPGVPSFLRRAAPRPGPLPAIHLDGGAAGGPAPLPDLAAMRPAIAQPRRLHLT